MNQSLGASQATGLGSAEAPEPFGLRPTGAIPSAELCQSLDALLHPFRGVERGLLGTDAPNKLLRITVREVRAIAQCLRMARTFCASAIEAQRAETAETGSVADESAASEAGDAR